MATAGEPHMRNLTRLGRSRVGSRRMAKLLLGPLLRYVGETDAMVWVETDGPCEVSVLGTSEPHVQHLRAPLRAAPRRGPRARDRLTPTRSSLDGERRWPEPRLRPARRAASARSPAERPLGSLRLLPGGRAARSAMDAPDQGRARPRTRVRRAARARARMRDEPRREWPDLLLLLGDQVYADEGSPRHRAFAESRRDTEDAPGRRVTRLRGVRAALPRESWSDPVIRWLLSTVPTSMIFDDHDVHDDWNISAVLARGDARASPGGTGATVGPDESTGSTSTSATSRPEALRRGRALPPGARQRPRDARSCASSPSGRARHRRRRAGASAATSAAPA